MARILARTKSLTNFDLPFASKHNTSQTHPINPNFPSVVLKARGNLPTRKLFIDLAQRNSSVQKKLFHTNAIVA